MKKTSLILLTGLTLMPASAWAGPNKEYLQLLAEVRMLQEQNQEMRQLFGTLQDSLKAMSAKLDEQTASNRKALADETLSINNIGDTVRVLREKADDTNVRISTVSQEIQALRQAVASMPQPAAQQPPAPMGAGDAGGTPASAPPQAPTAPPGVSPGRMYDTSYDDFTAGRYDTAIKGFELFIQYFPQLPQAAAAQFNIGASYYNQGKWNEARDAFMLVTTKYPQDVDTNAQAWFKLGQTYEALKQLDQARKAYDTVMQKYPTSFQANQANQALQRLKR